MPVREGKMECTTCHNPHGSTNDRMLKTGTSVNELCASCYADTRGPDLFEHAGINGESCATCHDPHGSNNDRMLVAKLPFLCQRCHAHTRHPGTIYDNKVALSSNRLYSRSYGRVTRPFMDRTTHRVRLSCGRRGRSRTKITLMIALPGCRGSRARPGTADHSRADQHGRSRTHVDRRQGLRHRRLRRTHLASDRRRSPLSALSRSAPRVVRHQLRRRPTHPGLVA